MKSAFAVVVLPAVLLSTSLEATSAQLLDAEPRETAVAALGGAELAQLLGVLQADDNCDDCCEMRAHPNSTVYYHKFGDGCGGANLMDEDEWVSAGNRRCWGTPEDNTCHTTPLLTRCDDSHSSCGGGETLLEAALRSPQPSLSLRYLIAARSRFQLDRDASSVTIYDCEGETRTVPLPPGLTRELLQGARTQRRESSGAAVAAKAI